MLESSLSIEIPIGLNPCFSYGQIENDRNDRCSARCSASCILPSLQPSSARKSLQMAYKTTTPIAAASSTQHQTHRRRAAAVVGLLLCGCCVAFLGGSRQSLQQQLTVTTHNVMHEVTPAEGKAMQLLQTWSGELAEFATAQPKLTQLKESDASLDLSSGEKTEKVTLNHEDPTSDAPNAFHAYSLTYYVLQQNTCLNKKYAELIAAHQDEQARNKVRAAAAAVDAAKLLTL